jgi:hypothetical protein
MRKLFRESLGYLAKSPDSIKPPDVLLNITPVLSTDVSSSISALRELGALAARTAKAARAIRGARSDLAGAIGWFMVRA